MTREEAASGLVGLSDWLEKEGLLFYQTKECLDFAIGNLFAEKSGEE